MCQNQYKIVYVLCYWILRRRQIKTRFRSKVFSLVRPWVKVKPSIGAKFFQTRNCFGSSIFFVLTIQIFFRPKTFRPSTFQTKNISDKSLSDPKFYSDPKLFWTQHFFGVKKCTQIFSNIEFFWILHYFDQNLMGLKSFLDQKFFLIQTFSDPNFFPIKNCSWFKFFWDPKIFETKKFLD